jgi:hypothetical protein
MLYVNYLITVIINNLGYMTLSIVVALSSLMGHGLSHQNSKVAQAL